jgi:hypothetical protein
MVKKVVKGACYVTATGQHRLVLKISGGRVHHIVRGRHPGPWAPGHNKTFPPSVKSFLEKVSRRVLPRPHDAASALKKWRSYG